MRRPLLAAAFLLLGSAGTDFSTSFAEMGASPPVAWHGANNRYTFTVHPSGTSNSERRQESVGEPATQTHAQPFARRVEFVRI